MSIIASLLLILIINSIYKRYMPVYGIPQIDFGKIYGDTDVSLLDVRDNQAAHRSPVEGAVNIPYAYLRRNHGEMENKEIYLMASTMMDINLSARFLIKKGFNVNGYYIKPQSKKTMKNAGLKKERYSMEYTEQMKNRMKRVEGQVKGILRMMEENKECKDLVVQMSAARNALDRAIGLVVSSNLEQCVRDQIEKGESTEDHIQEAVNLLVKSR